MLQVILLPLLAAVGGAGGFFLRQWELVSAFDENGLSILWTPATLILIAWSVLLALAFVLLCRRSKYAPSDYAGAFSAPRNWLCLAVSAVAAAHLLVAGVLGLAEELGGGSPGLLRLLFYGMCVVSFVCLLFIIPGNFRGKSRRYSLTLLLPAYTCCLWLVTAYQQRQADPVVLDYVYELLAIICTLLGLYFIAGFSFGRGRVWLCALFCLLGVYFCIVTLADSHDQITRLLLWFSILYQLAAAVTLLYHAFAKAPAQPPEESDQTQEVIPDE